MQDVYRNIGIGIEIFHLVFGLTVLAAGSLWLPRLLHTSIIVATVLSWPITGLISSYAFNKFIYCPISLVAEVFFRLGRAENPFPPLFGG